MSGRLIGVQCRTCAGLCLALYGHGPTEDASAGKKDWFVIYGAYGLQAWPESLHTFLNGELDVRWAAQLPHESPLLGPSTAGEGREFLEPRPMLDNGSRGW